MSIAALITWFSTALIGLYLLVIWLIEYDPEFQAEAATELPVPVISTHVLLAVSGLVLWAAYLITDAEAVRQGCGRGARRGGDARPLDGIPVGRRAPSPQRSSEDRRAGQRRHVEIAAAAGQMSAPTAQTASRAAAVDATTAANGSTGTLQLTAPRRNGISRCPSSSRTGYLPPSPSATVLLTVLGLDG